MTPARLCQAAQTQDTCPRRASNPFELSTAPWHQAHTVEEQRDFRMALGVVFGGIAAMRSMSDMGFFDSERELRA